MSAHNATLKRTLYVIIFTTFLTFNFGENILSRQKRFLLWPEGTHKIQVITGVGIPVDLQRETAIIGLFYKANYLTPTNISQITYPATIYARKKRGLTRWDIYTLLGQLIETRGLSGKPCVLRAICEVASSPFDRKNGLFDEILHTVFTPTSTEEELSHHTDNEYFAAHKLGSKSETTCQNYFPECHFNVLDLLSDFYNGH